MVGSVISWEITGGEISGRVAVLKEWTDEPQIILGFNDQIKVTDAHFILSVVA